MCTRHVECDASTTIIGTQGEITHVVKMDNKGAADSANNWSVDGQTKTLM